MLAFEMTTKRALEFFRRVRAAGATTEQEKTDILIEMANEGKMLRVSHTRRSKEEFIRDAAKNRGKVLVVRSKKGT